MVEEHSEISPSGFKRVIHCPGSRRMCKGIEDIPSVYAEEGNAAHLVGEHCLIALKNTKDLTDGVNTFTAPEVKKWVTEEMYRHVDVYLDTIYEDSVGNVVKAEQRVDLDWIYPGMKGTSDAYWGEPFGTLHVYDLKYGQGVVVEPEENIQEMLYALGVLGPDNFECYQNVELIIVQPRASHPSGPVRRWTTTVDHLYSRAAEFKEYARKTEDPKAILKAGDHCQFCPAMPVCPEMVLEAATAAMIEFGVGEPITDIVSTTALDLPLPETLSGFDIARVLDFSDIISIWAKGVKEHAKALMESGAVMPGYKLVNARANRKWVDAGQAESALIPTFGDHIYTIRKLKSPAQIEKLSGIDKKVLAVLWEKPNVGVTIAKDSDKREAVAPSAVDDFEDDFLE